MNTTRPKRVRIALLAAALTTVGVAIPVPVAAAVDPGAVELTVAPGASSTFAANVTTPVVTPDPDIVFLADTTGSMNPALANVRNNIPTIMSDVLAVQPNSRFGVAEYKEQADSRVFGVNTNLTGDQAAVVNGAHQWLITAGGGGHPQTDFLNAHYRLATDAIAFRPNSSRVVVWFGDARSNDPSLGHTLAATVQALRSAGIRVIAVPVTGTSAPGLDEFGQATAITAGTSGMLMPGQPANAVAAAILDGLHALTVSVTPKPACDPQLTLTTNPASRTVRSGTTAAFAETVGVRADAAPGTYRCTVDFQVNGLSVGYTQTVTMHVPGTRPGLRISDVTVDEGDSGATPATLTVSLDAPSTQTVTVGWSTIAGTASDADFTPGSGTVTFAPGDTSEQVTVNVTGDEVVEGDETFTVRLANPTNATISDADGTVTIRDDDVPTVPPTLSIGDTSVPEGDTGSTPGTLTVSLDRASTSQVTVDWATVAGTAGPADSTEASGTITFAPGQTTRPVPVSVTGDDLVETNETFTVRLSNPANATIGDGDGTVTILDEDDTTPGVLPKVRIGDASGPEGNVGTTPRTLTVVLDKPSATEVTVEWTTAPGTAGQDDFVAAAGELRFRPNEVSQQLTVEALGDRTPEDGETFQVRLTSANGADIADDTGLATIEDDDQGPPPVQVPQLRIGDVSLPEGNAGATPATITVVLDQASTVPVTVHWATQDGSATAPGDYVAGADDLTFTPGVTARQITVPVVGDRTFEQSEAFGVRLSNPVDATIADGTALITVINDDSQTGEAELTVDDVTVLEGAGQAVATVRLSAGLGDPVTVRMTTVDGSATDPADYVGGSAVLTFPPGQTVVSAPIAIVADTVDEGDETFTVTLSDAIGAPVGDPTGTVTILDDDGTTVLPSVSVDDTSVVEAGGTAVFPVHLTKASATPVTVTWATATGTAGANDFTASDGQVQVAAGETTGRIEVPVTDDAAVEGDETFTVTLSAPAGATLGDATATGTILDDDDVVVRPTVSVADTSVPENAGPAGFEVRLSEAATEPVTVRWATADGTAKAPGDYASRSDEVVFTPGQTTALVTVPVVADTLTEGDETFTVTLSDPAGADLGDGTAVGTIVDVVAPAGTFRCTASAADLFGNRPAVANPRGTPCADDSRTVAKARVGLGLLTVTVNGLTASTDAAPGGMSATAGLLTTRISTIGLSIEIGAMTSAATATCVAGPTGLAPTFAGSSQIASLKINGVRLPIGAGPVTIPLVVGSLSLNSTVTTQNGLTQRAFDLRTILGDVVIGESTVGVTGNPCR
jgi:hypothetical protein